jgi:hypothetical protein
MSASIGTAAATAVAATGGTAAPAQAAPIDRADAQAFARLVGTHGLAASGASGAPGALQDAANSLAAQLGGNARSIEEIRASMLQSIDLRDPIRTMFVLTDTAIEAQATFARLHISSSLASAATSLFGTLLKNQQ